MQESYSSAPLRTVKEIQFGLFSPEEVRAISVLKISTADTFDEKGQPILNGLNSPLLGSVDRNNMCQTCHEGMSDCPGHFGHIELAKPVFNIAFLGRIKKVLESVCIHCGKLLQDEFDPLFKQAIRLKDPKKRFNAVWTICKAISTCETDVVVNNIHISRGGCGHVQPQIKFNGIGFLAQFKKNQMLTTTMTTMMMNLNKETFLPKKF